MRRKAIEHVRECTRIAQQTGSSVISLWLADGTNYPGQDSIRGRKRRLEESLKAIYADLPASQRLLIEYKFYEPAFYLTDLADWGTAYAPRCGWPAGAGAGPRPPPPGHHIEQIVAFLIDEGRSAGSISAQVRRRRPVVGPRTPTSCSSSTTNWWTPSAIPRWTWTSPT